MRAKLNYVNFRVALANNFLAFKGQQIQWPTYAVLWSLVCMFFYVGKHE